MLNCEANLGRKADENCGMRSKGTVGGCDMHARQSNINPDAQRRASSETDILLKQQDNFESQKA